MENKTQELKAIRKEHLDKIQRFYRESDNPLERAFFKGHLIGFEICFVAICSELGIENPFQNDDVDILD